VSCPDCARTARALARLRVKHKRFAAETNRMMNEWLAEIADLRARLGEEKP
jgi:hypothetical protein